MVMKIMSSARGLSGDPVTLAAVLDPATGVLVVTKKVEFREEPDEGFAFVTNFRCETYDSLFLEEHWNDAIKAFKQAESAEALVIMDEVNRWRPRIETDGVDERGQKYRLREDMENGEMAILALVHFHERQRSMMAVDDAVDEFFDLVRI